MPQHLPVDYEQATLLGRLNSENGPLPVLVADGRISDISALTPTLSHLLETLKPGEALPRGRDLGPVADYDFALAEPGESDLLAPVDLHCIKASGVTFAVSALERVIEEKARGDAAGSVQFRETIVEKIGGDLKSLRPGSPEAARLKETLIASGAWSQYLEVAIGPDAEIFTKAPVLSAVGAGAFIGIRSDSHWNNPEPEIVVIADSKGAARGAALGNDVNLRDIEGRSALLLGKAKDNNASCAIGPFVRLFDGDFTIDDVRGADVSLAIAGDDGYTLSGVSSMRQISRDPLDLLAQAMGKSHQYPDGFALFLGTMFAPVDDRDEPGHGFTHKIGDVVTVSTPRLGALTNTVCYCEDAPPWTYGISALMRDLSRRGFAGA